ncbi:MAG: homoserine dehydrogenase, partial [Candidatus Dormibacteraceae bacterium]
IGTLRGDLAANRIQRVMAIINGTTNHMLTQMASQGLSFTAALRAAQAAGYAEADPTEDVEGHDAASKLAIIASIAFAAQVFSSEVYIEGITQLDSIDFQYARELGYAIKLLAYANCSEREIEARVHPCMISRSHPLAMVDGVTNAVFIEGDLVGEVLLQGPGAGGRPTTSSVIGDLITLVRSISRGPSQHHDLGFTETRIRPMAEVMTRAYFRCAVADRPGVLAQICTVFGEEGVSIAGANQREVNECQGRAELIVVTHAASDGALQLTRKRISELAVVDEVSSFVRML